ncbi:hypothetical protein MHBO_001722 [Bonamia ostreae]|uniref:Uncharacterized protein n=1 Tax=Bonamia ostreae TaxID=126728 RepID=A0ABV2AKH7_9EUKA
MIKTNKDFRKNILKAIFQNFLEICEDQKGLNFLEKIGILLTNTELINLHKEIGHYLEILMQSKDIEYAIKKITNGSGTFIRNLFKVK